MQTINLNYSTWKSKIQGNNFTVYEIRSGPVLPQYPFITPIKVIGGNIDYVLESIINEDDLSDYQTTFINPITVSSIEEAHAEITGL